jgi:hypothetical protein
MSFLKADDKPLKLWERGYGLDGYAYIRAVPGGWGIEQEEHDGGVSFGYHVPDPNAPHVRKVAAAEERIAKALKYIADDPVNLEHSELTAILRGE